MAFPPAILVDEFEAMNNTAHNYWSVGHYVGFLLDRLLEICEYGATSVNIDEMFIPMPAVAGLMLMFNVFVQLLLLLLYVNLTNSLTQN